ncbi:hypothetical protein LTR56_010932 [Elasticomyces elasticus]|nr:hypothetical protein LTR56_010932 [Elasticomyces elasticus]KAK3662631.1 hypothetical protein LTR22_006481 [Elasticomyces elasticus]KAK4926585.1 hypothetical protein LTR49_006519 [Elasticomyces elasticus]KAK5760678.1 hypothetical protein LTS12_009215 [Elasticomyces elasticus]
MSTLTVSLSNGKAIPRSRLSRSERKRENVESQSDDKPSKKTKIGLPGTSLERSSEPLQPKEEAATVSLKVCTPLKKAIGSSKETAEDGHASDDAPTSPQLTSPAREVNSDHERSKVVEKQPDAHVTTSEEELARYNKCTTNACDWLVGLEKHEQALSDQAAVFAQLVASLLQRLNESHRVPRLTIEDYGQPNFEELINAAEALPRDTNDSYDMLDRVEEAILVQLAAFPRTAQRGLAEICESMQKPLRKIRIIIEVVTESHDEAPDDPALAHECYSWFRGLKFETITLYQKVLQDWAKLVADSAAAMRELEQRYLADVNQGDDQQHAYKQAAYAVGAAWVSSAKVDYDKLKCAYEAAFATAAMLSPATFAYESWRDKI